MTGMTAKAAAALAILSLAVAASAETSSKDLAVASRALGFLEPRLSGATPVVIFYEAGDTSSEADARSIRAGIASGGTGATFQGKLASSSDIGAITGAKVVFLATGIRNQPAIFAAAARQHVITISSDMGCVRAGRCVIGVRAQPSVEIVVSRAAREASNVNFSRAFLMLVKEQ
ncbi:MAG: hypothetical protein JWR77_143 [Rhizorhabdus sp.]|nr:hypothetical protein [Rhizorhabdus sp.]